MMCNQEPYIIMLFFLFSEMENQAYSLKVGLPKKLPRARATFTYEKNFDKLYTQRASRVPFKIKVTNPTGSAVQVRVIAAFTDRNFRKTPVKSCTQHSWCLDSPHYVMASDNSVRYTGRLDATSRRERLAVIKALPGVQGTSTHSLNVEFPCYENCRDGPNLRKVQLRFYLENMQGQKLNRKILNLQVCTTPHRNRREERARAIEQ